MQFDRVQEALDDRTRQRLRFAKHRAGQAPGRDEEEGKQMTPCFLGGRNILARLLAYGGQRIQKALGLLNLKARVNFRTGCPSAARIWPATGPTGMALLQPDFIDGQRNAPRSRIQQQSRLRARRQAARSGKGA